MRFCRFYYILYSFLLLIELLSVLQLPASAEQAIGPLSPAKITEPVAETSSQELPIKLRPPIIGKEPITLSGAVRVSEVNYPAILKAMAQVKAARKNITVQKLNEYLPDSLCQVQEIMASRNKITQIIYGSPVFPGNPGPGNPSTSFYPLFFSGWGYNLDWAPIDFGLHKARIQLSRQQYSQTNAMFGVTKLDVAIAAASAFLDVVEAMQQVKAAQENVDAFQQFATVVHAQVNAYLKAGADAALADAQVAGARNQFYRAKLNYDVARANLGNSIGIVDMPLEINSKGIASETEEAQIQKNKPVFTEVPILKASQAALLTAFAQKKVLMKEYFPVFHWLYGMQLRGTDRSFRNGPVSLTADGLIPVVPNYQLAMIVNWNFLDWFRLHEERKVQDQRIVEQQQQYNLIMNNLKTEDLKSRARVRTALEIVRNTPVQVDAAEQAARQAEARYGVGLSSVAQVAEANQLLAQSRMQLAIAKVGVWRAMLDVASVHGDLKPFLAECDRIQKGAAR